MRLRLLLSFLVGAVFFTVLPIYAPFVLLQTTDMPLFLLGLGAGVVAGAVLALINGSARGLLLVLACAFVGASIYVFAYFVPMFSEGGEDWLYVVPSALLFALAYSVLPAAVGVALAVVASSLLARRGRAVHQSARVPTPEADVPVPPPPQQRPPVAAAGEGVGATPARRRGRDRAVRLLFGAIILGGIMWFVSTLVTNVAVLGGTVADNIGLAVASALQGLVSGAIYAMVVMLLGGSVIYLLDRERRSSANTSVTFLQAALSWQVLVIAAGAVFLNSLIAVAALLGEIFVIT